MSQQLKEKVLVTGATGYIASYAIKELLELGYRVRGSVRSLDKKEKYEFLHKLSPSNNSNLELVEADLLDKESWLKATEGVDYVLHIASPIPPGIPQNEDEIIKPAVEGTLNVLEASVRNKVKKVVVTSSCLAIFLGNDGKVNSEEDWSDVTKAQHYPKSKILAERAAWEFYEKNKSSMEMTVVNPSLVLGPGNTIHGNSSEAQLLAILNGTFAGYPEQDINYAVVDVRDTAQAHIKALFSKNSNGKRYISSAGLIKISEIFNILAEEFNKQGYSVQNTPKTLDELKALNVPIVNRSIAYAGKALLLDNKRGIQELGFAYTDLKKTVIDMAYRLIELGLAKKI